MNTRIITLAVIALCLTFASCRSSRSYPNHPTSSTGLPPGHAKKVYGHKSAKAFAPGQRKKKTTTITTTTTTTTSNSKKSKSKKGKG